MKLLIINTKKILVTVVLLLIVGLFANSVFSPTIETFNDRREEKSTIKQMFKEYNAGGTSCSYKLPAKWDVWENQITLDNELYKASYQAEKGDIYGDIHVIKASNGMTQNMEIVKNLANTNSQVKSFELNEIMVNQKTGCLYTYVMNTSQNVEMKNYQAIIENGDKLYIISMKTPIKEDKKYIATLFNNIVQSFSIQ